MEEIECSGFFNASVEGTISCLDKFQASGIFQWFFGNILEAFYNLFYVILNPESWLAWLTGLGSDAGKQSLMRFVYYGGSVEFFFVVFIIVLAVTIYGFMNRQFLWGVVRVLEAFGNSIGRVAAWAGLLMVLQQVVIVFMQRIFTKAELSFGAGDSISRDISWWSEELKLYNAIIVCLCCAYTFIQGGHVRVDLVYSAVKFRTKRIIDMIGSIIFVLPSAVLIWMYGWFFMWRHLITPKVNATDTVDQSLMKARAVRWNVETIGFSPNGFDAYFLFKVLIVAFAGMIFLQGLNFFYRSWLEFKEGPDSEGRYMDVDRIEPDEVEMAAPEHLAREGR